MLSRAQLARLLAFAIVTLVLSGVIANYITTQIGLSGDASVAKVVRRFDLGHEPSLPNFLSAVGHLACAAALFVTGRLERRNGSRVARDWTLMGCVFIFLSFDEAIMFHEMLDKPLSSIHLNRLAYLPWTIVGAAAAIAFALGASRVLRAVDRQTRWLLLTAGAIFVGGAVGMEFFAGMVFAAVGGEEQGIHTLAHLILQAFEEGMEMSGIGLFFWAICNYVIKRHGDVVLQLA